VIKKTTQRRYASAPTVLLVLGTIVICQAHRHYW